MSRDIWDVPSSDEEGKDEGGDEDEDEDEDDEDKDGVPAGGPRQVIEYTNAVFNCYS